MSGVTNRPRWTTRRKAAVVEAIREGRLGREAAMAAYGLSEEELRAWEHDFAVVGDGACGCDTCRGGRRR